MITPEAKRLQKAIDQLASNTDAVKVGWFESSRYPDGTQVAEVAVIQEFGAESRNIPWRPFMRPTVIQQQQAWAKVVEYQVTRVMNGDANVSQALEAFGSKVAGDIRYTITQVFTPSLQESTIYARLHRKSDKKTIGLLTKPLMDTGAMYGTLTHAVERE